MLVLAVVLSVIIIMLLFSATALIIGNLDDRRYDLQLASSGNVRMNIILKNERYGCK